MVFLQYYLPVFYIIPLCGDTTQQQHNRKPANAHFSFVLLNFSLGSERGETADSSGAVLRASRGPEATRRSSPPTARALISHWAQR